MEEGTTRKRSKNDQKTIKNDFIGLGKWKRKRILGLGNWDLNGEKKDLENLEKKIFPNSTVVESGKTFGDGGLEGGLRVKA